LKGKSAALWDAINRAEAVDPADPKTNELIQQKQSLDKRIARLKTASRTGNELGD
jgi:hypothetical protein